MYIEKTSDKYFYPEENEEIWNINSKWKYKTNSCCLPEPANEMERIIEFSKKQAGHSVFQVKPELVHGTHNKPDISS